MRLHSAGSSRTGRHGTGPFSKERLDGVHRAAAALITAGAAAVVLALAAPEGASTGTAEISPEQAGYTATGAQFDFVQAAVY